MKGGDRPRPRSNRGRTERRLFHVLHGTKGTRRSWRVIDREIAEKRVFCQPSLESGTNRFISSESGDIGTARIAQKDVRQHKVNHLPQEEEKGSRRAEGKSREGSLRRPSLPFPFFLSLRLLLLHPLLMSRGKRLHSLKPTVVSTLH